MPTPRKGYHLDGEPIPGASTIAGYYKPNPAVDRILGWARKEALEEAIAFTRGEPGGVSVHAVPRPGDTTLRETLRRIRREAPRLAGQAARGEEGAGTALLDLLFGPVPDGLRSRRR